MARKRSRVPSPETQAAELGETIAEIRKRFGESSFQLAAQEAQPLRISTGIFMLDFALLGGIPHNRISMVVGNRHAGKSLLSDLIISNAQRQFPDMMAVKIDTEGATDPVWSQRLGVDLDRLYVMHPETGESAVDAAEALVRTKEVSIVIVDSLAALVPMKEIDDSAEDAQVGLQARLIGKMIRKLSAGLIAERNRDHFVTVFFVNQYRTQIGGWSPHGGEVSKIPGGRALEFATSVQLVMKNKENIGKDEYDVEAVEENEHAFDIKKNKVNAGPRTGEFRVRRVPHPEYGLDVGEVDDASTMLAYAKKFDAYHGGGSSWKLEFWGEERTVRGANEAIKLLYEDRALKWKLRNFLIHEQASHLGMPQDFLERFYPDE